MPPTGTNEQGIYTPALEPSFPSRHSSPRRRRRRHLRRQSARFRRRAAPPPPSPTTSPAPHRPLVADFPAVSIALLPLSLPLNLSGPPRAARHCRERRSSSRAHATGHVHVRERGAPPV